MFGKKYIMMLILDSSKDAMAYVGKEGYDGFTSDTFRWLDERPENFLKVTSKRRRGFIEAMLESAQYDKMFIFNVVFKAGKEPGK